MNQSLFLPESLNRTDLLNQLVAFLNFRVVVSDSNSLPDITTETPIEQIKNNNDKQAYIDKFAESLNITGLNITSTPNITTQEGGGCSYEVQQYLDVKIYLVAVCGTSISAISVLENVLLLYLFITRPQFRTSHLFYMMFLAFFDIFMSLSYICLMSVSVMMDYFKNLTLFHMWHAYLRPMFAISHVAMAASSFLIMAATMERFFSTTARFQRISNYVRNHRPVIAAIAIALGTIVRGTVFWELQVVTIPGCTGFEAMFPARSTLASNPLYDTIWRFWFRNFSTVFLPFFVLIFCNTCIVLALRKQNKETMRSMMLQVAVGNYNNKRHSSPECLGVGERVNGILIRPRYNSYAPGRQVAEQTKASVRAATRMLLLVVSCYLIANALNVIITAWEHINQEDLYLHHFPFYTLGSDVVSLLTVLASALRLPIYFLCNKQIRSELGIILRVSKERNQTTRCCPSRPAPYHAEVVEATPSVSNSSYTMMVPVTKSKNVQSHSLMQSSMYKTEYGINGSICNNGDVLESTPLNHGNGQFGDEFRGELDYIWHWESSV